jgi:hypothetical protein
MQDRKGQAQAKREDIVRLLGAVDDEEVIAVLSLQPTVAELEDARVWLGGQENRQARTERPQTARTMAILEIVDRSEDDDVSVQ